MPDTLCVSPRVRTYLAVCRRCGLTRAAEIAARRHSTRIGQNHLEQALAELGGDQAEEVR